MTRDTTQSHRSHCIDIHLAEDGTLNWILWGQQIETALRSSRTIEELHAVWVDNAQYLRLLKVVSGGYIPSHLLHVAMERIRQFLEGIAFGSVDPSTPTGKMQVTPQEPAFLDGAERVTNGGGP